MRHVVLGLLASAGIGCHHQPPPSSDELPFELPAGFSLTAPPEPEGPIAGPRNVVTQPPPPPIDPSVPGQGPMVPYVSKVRKALGTRLEACTDASPPSPAMVELQIAADGSVVAGVLKTPSGDATWDECLTGAMRQGELPIPPPELLAGGGSVTLPTMVFR
ncbi:MAG: TonB C-terminal domain-containing protein [Myxococcales bacterium]|nr:TonB C-terminal domain-containing protein [Myxococcales bacterium]